MVLKTDALLFFRPSRTEMPFSGLPTAGMQSAEADIGNTRRSLRLSNETGCLGLGSCEMSFVIHLRQRWTRTSTIERRNSVLLWRASRHRYLFIFYLQVYIFVGSFGLASHQHGIPFCTIYAYTKLNSSDTLALKIKYLPSFSYKIVTT